MPKVLIDQYIKEEFENNLPLPKFSYLVKFERKVFKGKTEIKVSYRDTRTNMDYKIIHESDKKEDYKAFIQFFKKEGYYKL